MSGIYDFSGAFNSINSAVNGYDEDMKEKKKKQALALEASAPQMYTLGDITAGASLLQLPPVAQQQAQSVNGAFAPVRGFVKLRGM